MTVFAEALTEPTREEIGALTGLMLLRDGREAGRLVRPAGEAAIEAALAAIDAA